MLPDLREVIESLAGRSNKLFPNGKEAIGFQWLGLRQPDFSKKCGCTPIEGTSENHTCTRCLNTGYLFTDYLVKGYFWMGVLGSEFGASPGILSTQQKNLVIEHDRPVSKFDFVLELDKDPETGVPRQPFSIMRYNRVQDSIGLKGDSAKTEFWKCVLEERNVEDGRPQSGGTTFKYQGNRSNNEPQ
tara:strand:+ start:69398 stop:69958 length:561 start_codon:yes stop_codon:yes gene_type:complete